MHQPSIKTDIQFLRAMKESAIELRLEGTDILCNASAPSITQEQIDYIVQRKNELISLLQSFEEQSSLPQIIPEASERHAPFPLTENQEAYWLGRSDKVESGGVGIHVFLELEITDFDRDRFEQAWAAVIQRHDMLRSVILPNGTQRIITPPSHIDIEVTPLPHDTTHREAFLHAAREAISHTKYSLFEWPQFTIKAFRKDTDKTVLMISMDIWNMDLRSMQIICDDLADIYSGRALAASPKVQFRDYVTTLIRLHKSPLYKKSRQYWRDRIKTMPPAPSLPVKNDTDSEEARFTRRSKRIGAKSWQKTKKRIADKGLTVSSVLLSCYASVLSRWSKAKHFTLNIPRYNRLPLHEEIDNIVGEFASFSLLEVDMRTTRSFVQLAADIQRQVWADLEHSSVSGVTVLREWRQSLAIPPAVMAPYVFTNEPEYSSINTAGQEHRSHSWITAMERMGEIRQLLTQTPQVWLDSQFSNVGDELYLSWDSRDDLFEDGLIDRMFEAYTELIESLDNDSAWEASTFELPESEAILQKILTGPHTSCSPIAPWEAIQKRAQRIPNELAISDSAGDLTWQMVHDTISTLSQELRQAGIRERHAVALAFPKSRLQFIAAMAVHATGATIVPVDAESPIQRLQSIVADSGAALTFADIACKEHLNELNTAKLYLTAEGEVAEGWQSVADAAPFSQLPSPLYSIIYTSGSTGTPKGVMIPKEGVLNVLYDAEHRMGLKENDCILSLNPFYHDMGVMDIFGAATIGWRLIFPDDSKKKDPGHWLELMKDKKATIWSSVPAMMTMLLDYAEGIQPFPGLPSLHSVYLGGDWIPLETPGRVRGIAPNATTISVGGPTEISIWNISYPVEKVSDTWTSIPYGTPINNTAYHILDEKLEECPALVTGEICCSGTGLSHGYLNDPQKTQAAFIAHPATGERLYKTGDLGRLHPDGYIEFIGRKDNRVNINGYRIELEEIEAILNTHPDVSQGIAVIQQDDSTASAIAVWVTLKPEAVPDPTSLKHYLDTRLPRHMLPAFIGVADSFPLTGNNKIARSEIAEWPIQHHHDDAQATASTPTEKILEAAWQDVLQCQTIGRDQNFFEIGGNSIAAVRLYNAITAKGYKGLSVASIFSYPTLKELGKAIDHLTGTELSTLEDEGSSGTNRTAWPKVSPLTERKAIAPATGIQKRMFYEDQRLDNGCYNLSLHISIRAGADVNAMKKACATLMQHHEIFRTTFEAQQDPLNPALEQIIQVLHPTIPLDFEAVYAKAAPGIDFESQTEGYCKTFTKRPYNLKTGPLLRFGMLMGEEGRAEFFVGYHHIIMDGWSLTPFVNGLEAALNETKIQTPHIQQADIAYWEQTEGFKAAIKDRISDAASRFKTADSPSVIPTAHSLNEAADMDNAPGVYTKRIPKNSVRQIEALCEKKGLTPFSVFGTLFGFLLADCNNSQTAQFGTFSAARTLPGLDEAVGAMTCPSPLVLTYDDRHSIAKAAGKTMEELSKSMESSLLPFDELVKAIAPDRNSQELPLFGVAFTYDNTPTHSFHAGGMDITVNGTRQFDTSIDFEVAITPSQNDILLSVVYSPEKIGHPATVAFIDRFERLLTQAASDLDTALSSLQLEHPEEQHRREQWSEGTTIPLNAMSVTDYLHDKKDLPHKKNAFYDVRMTTDGPEIYRSLSVKHVDLIVNTMCSRLIAAGLSKGDRVMLHMPRSSAYACAMLACMKCGISFIPAPMSASVQYIKQLMEISGAQTVCSQKRPPFLDGAPSCDFLKWDIDELLEKPCRPDPQSLPEITPDAEACLIFTSGSTGTPKGVRLTHGNWIHRLEAGRQVLPYKAGEACIAKTDIAFVDIFCEFFQPFFSGIPVYIIEEGEEKNVQTLVSHLSHWEITRAMIVVSLTQSILDLLEQAPENRQLLSLRHLTSSGEQMPPAMALRFKKTLPWVALHNYYGSTEVTADAVCCEVHPQASDDTSMAHTRVPLGSPVGNTRIDVLNARGTPQPHGMPGEICISGAGVAKGYAAMPSDRFSLRDGRHCFATGDIGMWSDNGELLGFGRIDRQLKIRGQRIEPSDIESKITCFETISDAVVLGLETHDETILAAALVPVDPGSFAIDDFRKQLRQTLRNAQMPSRLAILKAIPRTHSGKPDFVSVQTLILDHKGTVTPSKAATFSTPTERTVADIWQKLTGAMPPDQEADFFSCGGHSLLAVRLASLLKKEFGINIRVKDIFDSPAFSDIVELLGLLQESNPEHTSISTSHSTEVF